MFTTTLTLNHGYFTLPTFRNIFHIHFQFLIKPSTSLKFFYFLDVGPKLPFCIKTPSAFDLKECIIQHNSLVCLHLCLPRFRTNSKSSNDLKAKTKSGPCKFQIFNLQFITFFKRNNIKSP